METLSINRARAFAETHSHDVQGDDPRFKWVESSSEGTSVTGLSWSEIEWGFRSLRVRGQVSRRIRAIRVGAF